MFEKNLSALRENNPQLAKKLEQLSIDEAKEKISVHEAESKDLIIAYDELPLDSVYDPMRDAKTIWNKNIQSEQTKNDIQIVFGLGLGYLFKRVFVSCESRIVLIEPKIEILRFVLEYIDISAELSSERVYVVNDISDVLKYIETKYLTGDKLNLLYLPAYGQLAQQELIEFSSRLVKVCEQKNLDISTISHFAKKWAMESIFGVAHYDNALPLGMLKDKFKGKTALITSPGPSLSDDIELIKANRDKFLLIALNRTLEQLYKNGIKPDFVIYVDANGSRISDELIAKHKDEINLIVSTRTNRGAAAIETKNKFVYFADNDWIGQKFVEQFPELESQKTMSSVAHNAYYVAKLFGCEKIMFSGLDLAFKGESRYASSQDEDIYNVATTQIKNVNGEMVTSMSDYVLFARQFEDIIEEGHDENVYNTSSFGALIKGMKYIQLPDFVKKLESQDISKLDKVAFETPFQAKKWKDFIVALMDILKEEKNIIEDMLKPMQEHIKEIESTLDTIEKDGLTDEIKLNLGNQNRKSASFINDMVKSKVLFSTFQKDILEYTAVASQCNVLTAESMKKLKNKEFDLFNKFEDSSKEILAEINFVI